MQPAVQLDEYIRSASLEVGPTRRRIDCRPLFSPQSRVLASMAELVVWSGEDEDGFVCQAGRLSLVEK